MQKTRTTKKNKQQKNKECHIEIVLFFFFVHYKTLLILTMVTDIININLREIK